MAAQTKGCLTSPKTVTGHLNGCKLLTPDWLPLALIWPEGLLKFPLFPNIRVKEKLMLQFLQCHLVLAPECRNKA